MALLDQVFFKDIRDAEREFIDINTETVTSARVLWEAFKVTVCGKYMAMFYRVCKTLGHRVITMERQIADIDRQAQHMAEVCETQHSLKGELDEVRGTLGKHDYKVYKEMQYEQGDHPGRLVIVSVKNVNGVTLITQEYMLTWFVEFYIALYAQTNQDDEASIVTRLNVPLN
ncbi:hypothetical protein NDU88_006177 [Pleurodeles waltl]|uniref:Uncharacterized protein n=1 Tax=Pleurodeles waltl TaxID=8319 RepID=A0AAV7MF14_PLEWA|nr:hypothetical protein NDU88_006177 [Pleurodeles waltl]